MRFLNLIFTLLQVVADVSKRKAYLHSKGSLILKIRLKDLAS